ncbi:MAG: MmgE/PrpD family protein [Cypionkella sp.]
MLAEELANKVAGLNVTDLSDIALTTARQGLLDTVGVTLAGAHEPAALIAGRMQARGGMAPGPATLFGHDRRIDLFSAAVLNGTAAHALDFDDCSNTMGGHPSAPILPALWALAEAEYASGSDLLSAYVAGFEVETKLGRAVNFHHYEHGWHPTATLGTFGAAAACARLLRLPPARIAVALALAASMASGLKANFGTMAKPFHVGHCARNGLSAALLAAEGMTAAADVFEHAQGFFNVFDGFGHVVASRVLDEWMAPCDLDDPGIAFKRHPCCASTHPAIDALLRLRAAHGLTPANVSRIQSWTHPRRLRHTNRPDPRTGLDGKFSVQYVLSLALKQGRVGMGDFDDAAIHDPALRAIMAKVEAAPHPEARMDSDEHFFALVRITTTDGRVLETYVDRPLGRDRDHRLPDGALEAKFLDCAAQSLTEDSAASVLRSLLAIEQVKDIGAISRGFVLRDRDEATGKIAANV